MATIQKWGNSVGLRIPKKIAQAKRMDNGTPVKIREIDRGIVIEPVDEEPSLKDMLGQITPENRHEPIDDGGPVGKEWL